MAGSGRRMKEEGIVDLKPFIDVLGKPMFVRVLENIASSHLVEVLLAVRAGTADIANFHIERSGICDRMEIKTIELEGPTSSDLESLRLVLGNLREEATVMSVNCDQWFEGGIDDIYRDYSKQQWTTSVLTGIDGEEAFAGCKVDSGLVVQMGRSLRTKCFATGLYFLGRRCQLEQDIDCFMALGEYSPNRSRDIVGLLQHRIENGEKLGHINFKRRFFSMGNPDSLTETLRINPF